MSVVRERKEQAIHVGVNAHLLSLAADYRSAGINWYIYHLLQHLPETDPEIDYTVFMSEKRYEGVPGIRLQTSRFPTHRPPVRILWEQVAQPWAVRQAGLDLLHGPAFVGPQASNCPSVITIHDLSFLLYPENFRLLNRLYLKTFTRQSVRRARRVIAVSDSTKRDLVRYYDLPATKIDVIHNGRDASFRPLPEEDVAAFRTRRDLPDRFVLFVGTLEPRKNVTFLIDAYSRLPAGSPPLILVGGKGWLYDEIFRRIEALGLESRVRFAGYVPAADLPWWYNAAELFVYPSLYEGFGLPPLEAMACGTPVIASTASSLPEVVGDAGLLVDPADTGALAESMARLLVAPEARDRMREAGLARAQAFSWPETARQTARTYRRALRPDRQAEEGGTGV